MANISTSATGFPAVVDSYTAAIPGNSIPSTHYNGLSSAVVAIEQVLSGTSATNRTYLNTDQAQTSLYMKPTPVSLSGVQQQFSFAAEIVGGDGGAGVARAAIVGMAASSGSSQNQVYAGNFNASQQAGDTRVKVTGLEIDLNVNDQDDTINQQPEHIGLGIVSAGAKKAGPAALSIGSSDGQNNAWWRGIHIGINQIANGGFAIHYLGDATSGPFIVTSECKLYLGVDGAPNVDSGDMCIKNAAELRALNAAGTDTVSVIKCNSSNRVEIGTALQMPNGVVATGSLPAAGAGMDGTIIIEDAGAGDRNLIIYAGGQRFRIDGGAAF